MRFPSRWIKHTCTPENHWFDLKCAKWFQIVLTVFPWNLALLVPMVPWGSNRSDFLSVNTSDPGLRIAHVFWVQWGMPMSAHTQLESKQDVATSTLKNHMVRNKPNSKSHFTKICVIQPVCGAGAIFNWILLISARKVILRYPNWLKIQWICVIS